MGEQFGDVTVVLDDRYVAEVEIHRPPNNYFDASVIRALADAFSELDRDPACRAIVLCSEGKHFCAGAQLFNDGEVAVHNMASALYGEGARLFGLGTPVIAAVQGAAVGGGLGLACAADFRVAARDSRFVCNFARIGHHPGFGLTTILPKLVGAQRALELMYIGRPVDGREALEIGLVDALSEPGEIRSRARRFAAEIAAAAPLAIAATRHTMRDHLGAHFRRATERERVQQERLRATADFQEGVRAAAERRVPHFKGA